jgi:hypothetical protein
MQQKDSNEPSGSSTMVEPFSHYPRMEGSNPAAGTGGDEMRETKFQSNKRIDLHPERDRYKGPVS